MTDDAFPKATGTEDKELFLIEGATHILEPRAPLYTMAHLPSGPASVGTLSSCRICPLTIGKPSPICWACWPSSTAPGRRSAGCRRQSIAVSASTAVSALGPLKKLELR